MKNMIFLISLMIIISMPSCSFGKAIYISESLDENNWVISIFSSDGTMTKKITGKGQKARISPEKKYIASLQRGTHGEELIISDINGNQIKKISPYSQSSQKKTFDTIKLLWSPDESKIAALLHSRATAYSKNVNGHPVILNIISVNSESTETVYNCYAATTEESYAYKLFWLPDSTRILFSGVGRTEIINTSSNTKQTIAKNTLSAHLTKDSKRIMYLSGIRSEAPIEIQEYDLCKKTYKRLLSLQTYPAFHAFSHDGIYFVFQNFPVQEPALFIGNLKSGKIRKIATGENIIIPVLFPPHDNNLIFCLGGNSMLQHGIYNINKNRFLPLKPLNNPESSMNLIMDCDWIQWR